MNASQLLLSEDFRQEFTHDGDVSKGVGCNQPKGNDTFPIEFYSTKNIALDNLAVVRDLKLDHYILYGESYGTMVATETAGLAESGGNHQPDSVVLEGVVGRAFDPMELFKGYIDEWNRVFEGLSDLEKQELLKGNLPNRIDPKEIGTYIANKLIARGKNPPKGAAPHEDPNLDWVNEILRDSSPNLPKKVREGWNSVATIDPNTLRMYQVIFCREIAREAWNANSDVYMKLENGKLVPIPLDICKGIPFDNRYDAKNWKIKAPIYYFVGKKDPSTPAYQAAYHFLNESQAYRTYVEVPESAHDALSTALSDCNRNIWNAIIRGGKALEAALLKCNFETHLKHKGPEIPTVLLDKKAPTSQSHGMP